MGTWGIKLYQNDTSLDVKDEFEEKIRNGNSAEEVTQELLNDFSDLLTFSDEEPLFWLALADTQWKWGMLLPEVKEKAIFWIKKSKKQENNTKRIKILEDLEQKLLSPQPPTKKIKKRRIYKCEWKIGDVFAYQLESELAKEKGLFGRYFLIQKVDEGTWYPGHIIPIAYVKITKDENLPSTIEEYNELEYVQTSFAKYEERFWPIDGRRPREDIAEKSKICYKVDEYGFLPEFRIELLNTSKKVIPQKLKYIGNYKNAMRPKKEFIPHSKFNIVAISWKEFDETFETKMVKKYCGHNLRQLSIYSKNNKTE